MVADIGSLAYERLEEHIDKTRATTFARAAVKFVLVRQISDAVEKNNENNGWAFLIAKAIGIAASLTETADKRSWRLLPNTVEMARVLVPAHQPQSIAISFQDSYNNTIETRTVEIDVLPEGKKYFVMMDTRE